jgi:hypothetical protein
METIVGIIIMLYGIIGLLYVMFFAMTLSKITQFPLTLTVIRHRTGKFLWVALTWPIHIYRMYMKGLQYITLNALTEQTLQNLANQMQEQVGTPTKHNPSEFN